MSGSDYLYLSAAAVLLALVLSLALHRPPEKKTPPQETTRWKRFRVAFGALHGALKEATAAIVEDSGGLKLLALPRLDAPGRRVVLSRDGRRPAIELVRGRFFAKRKLRVRLGGKDWLTALAPRHGEGRPQLQFRALPEACDLHGDVAGREYEVRRGGKLIASVSWQRGASEGADAKEYVLEVLKGQDPLPLVALAAAVEVAMGPALNASGRSR
jgi:hypothetical protein